MDRDQRLFFVGLALGAAAILAVILLSIASGQTSGYYGFPPAVNSMVHPRVAPAATSESVQEAAAEGH